MVRLELDDPAPFVTIPSWTRLSSLKIVLLIYQVTVTPV